MATSRFQVSLQNGSYDELQHVKQLLQNHTEWNFSPSSFDIIPHPPKVALAHDEQNHVIACAVFANPVEHSSTYWLGFLIVDKSCRRMGVATALLTRLLDTVACGYVALVAAPTAVPLYQSFGFRELLHLNAGSWRLPIDRQSDATSVQKHDDDNEHNVLTIIDEGDALHTAAKHLYERIGGKRAFALDHIVQHAANGKCIVSVSEDKRTVYAAAWIRTVESEGGKGRQARLGPFVGGTDHGRLIPILKRAVRECARIPKVGMLSCLGLNESLLKEAAFERARIVPIMALRISKGGRACDNAMNRVELADDSIVHQYHALFDWHVG